MKDILFTSGILVFMICSVILHFKCNDSIDSMQQKITAMQEQMNLYKQTLLTAEREKEKVVKEYAETKKNLQQFIKNYGLSDLALPDDVMRLLKEGTTGTVDVPAPSDATGRDKDSGTN